MPPMRGRGNADIGLSPLFAGPIPPLKKIRFFGLPTIIIIQTKGPNQISGSKNPL